MCGGWYASLGILTLHLLLLLLLLLLCCRRVVSDPSIPLTVIEYEEVCSSKHHARTTADMHVI
jgi:hypothetical protein